MPSHKPAYKLTYYNYRGIAEPLRFMLTYAGVPFEDERLSPDSDDTAKGMYWKVPSLEDGSKTLNEFFGIARYLAAKHDLVPKDKFLAAKGDEMVGIGEDLRFEYRTWLAEKDEGVKGGLKKDLLDRIFPLHYMILNEFCAEVPETFLAGDSPTWYDFYLANMVDIFRDVFGGQEGLSKFPALAKHVEAVFDIPAIKSYVGSRPKTNL